MAFTETHKLHWARIRRILRVIGSRLLPETQSLAVSVQKTSDRVLFADREPGAWQAITEGDRWGGGNDKAWFQIEGSVPEHWAGQPMVLWMDVGSEALIYRQDGSVLHGITPGSFYNNVPWEMSRPFVDVSDELEAGQPFTLWADAGCLSHPWEEKYVHPVSPEPGEGGFPNGTLNHCRIGLFDSNVWNLYMDMEVLIGLCDGLPDSSPRYAKVFRALREACDQFGRDENDFEAVRAVLKPVLSAPASHSDVRVCAAGHAHLDTAWLWPLEVTRQKASRTFSNQLCLMDRYPEYVFGASTALHYQWIKEDFPELYQRIGTYVEEGRWEIQGGMWVEADTNIPSGESLIRQFLYGKNFFKEEFGTEIDLLWLPDVFGYSAALPQIMNVCGVRSLLTQKISWSQFNTFPHHTFLWEGIDGSETLVHFPPENNYCSSLEPKGLIDAQNRFAERDRLDSMLSLFGYGDGGGGATPFHLERAERLKNLEGAPKVELGRADRFFEELHAKKDCLARWKGELYLELHRKTLTSQAFIKKANRRLEEMLAAVEMICSIRPDEYPRETLDSVWKTLLLNQFHDIIPGSSVKEVCDEARRQLDQAFIDCQTLMNQWAERSLSKNENSLTVFNPLSVEYSDLLELPGTIQATHLRGVDGVQYPVQRQGSQSFVSVPLAPLSFASFDCILEESPALQTGENLTLENEQVRFTFSSDGQLTEMVDRQTGRCYMTPGEQGNRLCLYGDRPAQWEAWDMDVYYEHELIETAECISVSSVETGPVFQSVRFEFTIGSSTISQTVRLANGSRRLDFETAVDWKENRKLLRVMFPTSILSADAAYDIQFGYLKRPTHRNTSRDAAMFEVCGHRYADLSQADCGVALLNDCKYGYKAHGAELSLSLLASPCMPDPSADRGVHQFTYSVLPHENGLIESPVQQEAAMLNQKPVVWKGKAPGKVPVLPVRLKGEGLRMEALKAAEDGDGLIVRVTETNGCCSSGSLWFSTSASVLESDAIEWTQRDLTPVGSEMPITLNPFEIKTWRIHLS